MKKETINKLNDLLMRCLLEDLDDPQKCTPGLYQVVRGVISDNKESLEGIPQDSLDFLEERLSDAIPFKKEAS
tara:strand:- start:1207 stop:1425 length:219 start_codon:yes stop_codon:yes gene_type:complete